MRKSVFTALLGLGNLASYAQTTVPKGAWQFDGSISYDNSYGENVGGSYTNSQRNSSFGFNSGVGYLVADNLALGLNGGYTHTSYEGQSDGGASSYQRRQNGFFVGPFADCYRLLTSYFGLKGRLSAGYGRSSEMWSTRSLSTYEYFTSTSNSVSGGLVPSLLFFPVPRLAIGASLGGLYYTQASSQTPNSVNGDGRGHSFYANFGLNQLALSGTFYPGRK